MQFKTHAASVAHREKTAHGILKRAGYKVGGKVKDDDKAEDAGMIHKHEKHLHKGEPLTKYKRGGNVGGAKAKHHAGSRSRGNHVHINIIPGASDMEKKQAAQQGMALGAKLGARIGGGPMSPPPPMPMPPRPPMAGPPGGAPPVPPRPPMAPPGMGPPPGGGMPPPGMPGMKSGGRADGRRLVQFFAGGKVKKPKFEYGGVVKYTEGSQTGKPSGGTIKQPMPAMGTRGKGFKKGGKIPLQGWAGSGGARGRMAEAENFGGGSEAVKAKLRSKFPPMKKKS